MKTLEASEPHSNESRIGWAAQFCEMSEMADDKLVDNMVTTTWDEDEWEWEFSDLVEQV